MRRVFTIVVFIEKHKEGSQECKIRARRETTKRETTIRGTINEKQEEVANSDLARMIFFNFCCGNLWFILIIMSLF